MQLTLNSESMDTEKMSTIEQECLIEKPLVNGSQEMNDVIKVIDDQKITMANKENIQVEENKVINTDENRNPDPIQELGAAVDINVHIKEEPKISIDNNAAATEDYTELMDSTEPICPVIENGIGKVTHEIDSNKSQSNSAEENEGSKNVDINIDYDIENNAKNETVKGGAKNEDGSLKGGKNLHEVTVSHDSIKTEESETIPHKATDDTTEAILGLGVESLPVCPNDEESVNQEIPQTSKISEDSVQSIVESESTIISAGDNSEFKEPSVDVPDVSEGIKKDDSKKVTEVVTVEKNNCAQLTMDVEIVSTECKTNVIADVTTDEKSKCAQIMEDVEMVSMADNNKVDVDIQGITKTDVSENGNEVCECDNEVKIVEDDHKKDPSENNEISSIAQKVANIKCTSTIRLSNTLDILSDDDEDPVKTTSPTEPSKVDKQKVGSPKMSEKCINLDDDDDIMLIDDVTNSNDKQKDSMKTVESGKLDQGPEPVNSKDIESSSMPVTSSDLGNCYLIIFTELCAFYCLFFNLLHNN